MARNVITLPRAKQRGSDADQRDQPKELPSMVTTFSADWASTCIAANPACGQLIRENDFSMLPLAPQNLVSRDELDRLIPR